MRASTAFFVGIGTVAVAIGAGLSGGLLIANMMIPKPHVGETSRLGRAASPQAMPSYAPLPYVGASLAFIDPALDGRAGASVRQVDRHDVAAAATQAAATTVGPTAKPVESGTPKAAGSEQPRLSAQQATNPQDSYAKAHDADLKGATEKRRASRSQHWAERHRQQRDHDQANAGQQAGNDDQQAGSNDQHQQAWTDGNAGARSRGDRTSNRNDNSRSDRYGRNNRLWADSDSYFIRRYRNAERDDWDGREWRGRDDRPRLFELPDIGW
jgi:hypothetical protein